MSYYSNKLCPICLNVLDDSKTKFICSWDENHEPFEINKENVDKKNKHLGECPKCKSKTRIVQCGKCKTHLESFIDLSTLDIYLVTGNKNTGKTAFLISLHLSIQKKAFKNLKIKDDFLISSNLSKVADDLLYELEYNSLSGKDNFLKLSINHQNKSKDILLIEQNNSIKYQKKLLNSIKGIVYLIDKETKESDFYDIVSSLPPKIDYAIALTKSDMYSDEFKDTLFVHDNHQIDYSFVNEEISNFISHPKMLNSSWLSEIIDTNKLNHQYFAVSPFGCDMTKSDICYNPSGVLNVIEWLVLSK